MRLAVATLKKPHSDTEGTSRSKSRRKPKPPRKSTILEGEPRCRARGDAEAWNIALENKKLIPAIIRGYNLDILAGTANREDVEMTVFYSLFRTAIKWDGKKKFRPFAFACAKECIYWAVQLRSGTVTIARENQERVARLLKNRKEIPDYSLARFVEEEKIPAGEVRSLRKAEMAMLSNRFPIDGHEIFNGVCAPEDVRGPRVTPCVCIDNCRLVENKMELQGEVEERRDMEHALGRVRAILKAALNKREYRVLNYRILRENPLSQEEVAKRMRLSCQWVSHLEGLALKKLSKFPYAQELKEHLETLMHYSLK